MRAGCALAALTGNVGVPGGWAGGLALQAPAGGPLWNVFPTGENPVKASIPAFLWTEAVVRGRQLGPEHGVRGAARLESDIKLVYAVASNAVVNQHANINRTAKLLEDERLVEFLVVQDNFLTPSARFADIVLPACTQFETWGVEDGWKYGDEVLLMPKAVEPAGETKSDYETCAELATRLGLRDAFTEGRTEREWVEAALSALRPSYPGLPALAEFEAGNAGVHQVPVSKPSVALADFRRDPAAHPLPTPSGKIELFSAALHGLGRPDEIPAVPKYIQEWESPFGPEARRFPLQVVGHHSLARVHSTMSGVDWLEEAFPQGAWWTPNASGVDTGGSVNVLTSERWTPLAVGNAQHTVMAEIAKA